MRGPINAIKQGLKPHLPYLAVLGLVTFLAGLPLFEFKLMRGHDSVPYFLRTIEFYEGLRSGNVFPRWAPDFAYGFGEPTFNFSPPVVYYLTAFFHVIGFSFLSAENLAAFAILVLSGLGMYLLAGQAFGPRGGLVSAVAYLFSPYLLVNLYVRHALADFSAFAFIPFAFWGLHRYTAVGGYWRLLIGAFSTALLVLSSTSVALITFPALLLLFATMLFFEWRDRESSVIPALARGLWLFLLSLGLSAFYWLPSLAETDFVHLHRRLEGYSDFHNHFLYIHQLVFPQWGYGLSLPGSEDGMNFAIGPIHLLLLATSLWVSWRTATRLRQVGFLVPFFVSLSVLAGFFSIGTSVFIWERLSFLQMLQFPWRFLSLIAMGTGFVSGSMFLIFFRKSRWRATGLMWILIVALVVVGFPHAKPIGFVVINGSVTPSFIVTSGRQDPLRQLEPIWVRQTPTAPAAERLTFIEGEGQVLTSKVTPTYYDFVTESTEATRMRVNTFYFPGWKVFVDEVERPVDIANLTGVMEFSL
ncbi:MAG TPA: hypothetical protein EYM65_12920, partial [Dehalococcoidia bacterium]|nr:hypothetical protein [Dehalococcoidia bacterium]